MKFTLLSVVIALFQVASAVIVVRRPCTGTETDHKCSTGFKCYSYKCVYDDVEVGEISHSRKYCTRPLETSLTFAGPIQCKRK